jgi:hypothetical protein
MPRYWYTPPPRHRRRRAAPAATAPAAASPAPAAPKDAETPLLDLVLKTAAVVVFVVGVIAVANWIDGLRKPAPGWVCTEITRRTAADTQRRGYCEPAAGWHSEVWPGVGRVAVPDGAEVERRHYVRDGY